LSGLPEAAALAGEIRPSTSPTRRVTISRRKTRSSWPGAARPRRSADPRITNSEGGDFADRRARYAYATSHGFAGEYATSSFSLSASPVASENGHMQRDGWYHVTRKRAGLDSPEEIGLTAARRAVRRLGARQVKTCEVPVIFDPEMAASLVRHIAGAAAGPALYRGASFLLGKLGEQIAAPGVTIVDDGTIPGGLGSRPFDGEGLPVLRTVIVDKGILTSYLLDGYSGRKLGMAQHHAARDGSGVTVGTTNSTWPRARPIRARSSASAGST
jgi:PmbA protein